MRLLALVALSVWTAVAAWQERQVSQPAADFVQVDVLVTDRAGQPIRDLTVDDLEIVENGRPQKIAEFRFVHVPQGTRDAAETRLFAIVIDDLHISLDSSKLLRIKEIVAHFLKSLTPGDPVAVVYTRQADASVDFTTDRAAQIGGLDRLKASLYARHPSPTNWRYDHRASLSRLRHVVRTLANAPQARRVVLFLAEATLSVNYPSQPDGVDELVDVYEVARRANVPIYPIDPRSLMTISGAIEDLDRERSQRDTLRELASATGGRAFVDRDKMSTAVEEILRDNGSFYVLAYRPDPLVRDGKFHQIEVRVKRANVRVRARTGYVAPGT